MEYPFDDLHAGIESQIMNLPAGIPDSEAVTQAKALRRRRPESRRASPAAQPFYTVMRSPS